MRFQRVLVAIDGSEFAAHALEVASGLATALSAQIGLVHVIDPKLVGGETEVPADQRWALRRTDGKSLLDTAACAIPAHPHAWKFLREGTPWKEIVDSAREWARRTDRRRDAWPVGPDASAVREHGRGGPAPCSGPRGRGTTCATDPVR